MNTSIYARQWDVGSFTDPDQEALQGERTPRWTAGSARARPGPATRRDDASTSSRCKHAPRRATASTSTRSAARCNARPPPPPSFLPTNRHRRSHRRRQAPALPTSNCTGNCRPRIIFEGYTIRRRARLDLVEVAATDDDTLTSTNTDPTCELTTRSRSEI